MSPPMPQGLVRALALALLVAGCTLAPGPPPATAPIIERPSSTTEPPSTTSTAEGTTSSTNGSDRTPTTTAGSEPITLVASLVDDGFSAPVLVRPDPAGGPDYVVEQSGTIVRADGGEHAMALDIRDDVLFDGEQGLLGLAFHPDFAANRLAYVNYVDRSRTTVIEQFEVISGAFDVSSRVRILSIPQPAANHNGGMLEFGPDGMLYVGMGDGGGANDRFGQAQRADTLLGAMLRIVVGTPEVTTYGIPQDNPFADGVAGRPEVWATGLRNPWRFAIDGNDLWIADVGQDDIEEVDLVDVREPARNYGWPIMEGDHCFQRECDMRGLVLPVAVYGHSDGCSISGGAVYRGPAMPAVEGHFFFSDFCSGFIRSYKSGLGVTDWTDGTGSIPAVAAISAGGDGELYVVSRAGGIYRLEPGA